MRLAALGRAVIECAGRWTPVRQNIMCFAIAAQDVRGACEALTVGVISEGSLQVYGSAPLLCSRGVSDKDFAGRGPAWGGTEWPPARVPVPQVSEAVERACKRAACGDNVPTPTAHHSRVEWKPLSWGYSKSSLRIRCSRMGGWKKTAPS